MCPPILKQKTTMDYMKVPCKHCPFRSDVKPFLTPERGEELAYATENRYNSFPCHKTTEVDEESEDGDMLTVETSKTCAGFLTMMAQVEGEECLPDGFVPSYDICYIDSFDMIQAYGGL